MHRWRLTTLTMPSVLCGRQYRGRFRPGRLKLAHLLQPSASHRLLGILVTPPAAQEFTPQDAERSAKHAALVVPRASRQRGGTKAAVAGAREPKVREQSEKPSELIGTPLQTYRQLEAFRTGFPGC